MLGIGLTAGVVLGGGEGKVMTSQKAGSAGVASAMRGMFRYWLDDETGFRRRRLAAIAPQPQSECMITLECMGMLGFDLCTIDPYL